MTSWIRGSMLRTSLNRKESVSSPPLQDVDPAAAFHTFIKHWQQASDIMARTKLRGQVFQDDVTAVVNHLSQMITLLMEDLRMMRKHSAVWKKNSQNANDPLHVSLPPNDPPNTPIFDHFLGEEILDNILTWSLSTGEYVNTLKLEQLKIHELLLSHSKQEILVYKPIIRPLLRLLSACGGCVPVEVEKRLVVLLNQLCVLLMHNHQLLDFFFQATDDQGPTKFLIFSLLLPFIHREGGIGQQARDALLLCMALSASHVAVGDYIAKHSDFCPVLATGMGGLYSNLPRSFVIENESWCKLSEKDLIEVPHLQMFINSLEFCNAVVQVAHPHVKEQLVDYLYQGFLVPVLGPALYQSVTSELICSTAYVELFLRQVTEPELVRAFLAFLLTPPNSSGVEPPVISALISRLQSSNQQLCLVTLNLFSTILSLHNEDAMVVLVFQYLVPCTHIMMSQRCSLLQSLDVASDKLLHLVPAACSDDQRKIEDGIDIVDLLAISENPQHFAHPNASPKNHNRKESNVSINSTDIDPIMSTLPSKYINYLTSVQLKVAEAQIACSGWTWTYDGIHPLPSQAVDFLDDARHLPSLPYPRPHSYSLYTPRQFNTTKSRSSSLNHKPVDRQISSLRSSSLLNGSCDKDFKQINNTALKSPKDDDDNFDSLGESSGYESFNIKMSRDTSPTHSNNGTAFSQCSNPSSPNSEHYRKSTLLKRKTASLKVLEELGNYFENLEGDVSSNFDLDECINEIETAHAENGILDDSEFNDRVPSLEDINKDIDWDNPPWLSSDDEFSNSRENYSSSPDPNRQRPSIGPFLEVLFQRVDQMLSSSIYINLLVTTLLTQLSSYPCPLLTTLLLDPSIVFQPTVRSLTQVLSGLKQRMDNILTIEDNICINEARVWFNMRLHHPSSFMSPTASTTSSPSNDSAFNRGENHRRSQSVSQTVLGFFSRGKSDKHNRESALENLPDGAGYRYFRRSSTASSSEASSMSSIIGTKKHAARCAVLLRNWLMELSALAREHCVSKPFLTFNLPHQTTASS